MGDALELHQPCSTCGSSDALAIYDDGEYCHSCNTSTRSGTVTSIKEYTPPANLQTGKFQALTDRGIKADTAKFFGVSVGINGEHYYPYTNSKGEWVFNKVRGLNKQFTSQGSSKDLMLFGQKKFNGEGRSVTITEGECDAMASYELQGSKYPVVSVRSASSAMKDCKQNFEWLDSFETIVLSFDADEAGQSSAKGIADLFGSKCKIMKMDRVLKDANGYLKEGKFKEYNKAWWDAERYMPDGLVNGADLRDRIKNKQQQKCYPSPWKGLDKLTYGFRTSEMWVVAAGSGMGKTQGLREMEYSLLMTTDWNIGGLFLEESAEDAGEGLMSIDACLPLHLPDTEITEEEWENAYDNTLATGRVTYYDAFGESDIDRILSRVRYLAKGLGCRVIFLDHISIMVSEQANGDERKALDMISTKLKKLTMELNILLIIVSHTKRQATKPHEEGGSFSLSDLRGTAGIGQLANMVIGLERNGQADDETERNTTKIRVVKNRFSGLTGIGCSLLYSKETGRLTELTPELMAEMEELDEEASI